MPESGTTPIRAPWSWMADRGARRTVHLIYPHGPRVSAPDSIGRELGRALSVEYEVRFHEWDAGGALEPLPGDVLIGHPHPDPDTIFRRSAERPGWKRIIAMGPYNEDPEQVSFLDRVLPLCDVFLAITGPYWFERIGRSRFAHWLPKMVRLDMAVNRADFPRIKQSFNPAGSRGLLYIGHSGRMKNTGYLTQIAARCPGMRFGRMGPRLGRIGGLVDHGWQDFASDQSRELVASYDFVITVGRFDANPTTVLEAMAWGLIPVCTPQSGYENVPGIVNVPLDDPAGAADAIERLQQSPEADLLELRALNEAALDSTYSWGRFAATVRQAIESEVSPPLLPESPVTAFRLRWYASTSRYHSAPVRLWHRTSRAAYRRLKQVARIRARG